MFWNIPSQRDPLFSHKWYILFGMEGFEKFVFGLKECSKPSYDISVTEHRHISGHVFRYPGTLKWKPIQVKFASVTDQQWEGYSSPEQKGFWNGFWDSLFPDKIIRERVNYKSFKGTSLSYFLENILKNSYYNNPDNIKLETQQVLNYQNISKQNSTIVNIDIIQVDDAGDQQEMWRLHNVFISNANYGTLTYESEQIVEITLTLQYDWATQHDISSFIHEKNKNNSLYDYKPPINQTTK